MIEGGDEKMSNDKLKVYCETSFWSYLAGKQTADEKIARDQALSLKWWQEISPACDIYISQHVTVEATRGSALLAARRSEVMSSALSVDGMIEEVRHLAATLLNAHAVPETEPTDALHIATASVYAMDVLLTLNCRHMANPVALPKTVSTISKAGYQCPIIITPGEFIDRREEFGL